MKRLFPTIIVVFLSACKSNHRIIEDAMRSVSSQTTYITAPVQPKPSPWWPVAVVFGVVALVLVALAAIYIHYNKQQLKAEAKPSQKRHVTKVYMPQAVPGQTTPRNAFYSAPVSQHPEHEYEEEFR